MERIILDRCGVVDPESLESYCDCGGFRALRKALFDMRPEQVVSEVKTSRLVGAGGAAFPTGVKWEMVSQAKDPARYVVCNADEGEPGTFKDRKIIEGDPFRIVEALTIAGYALGARVGYIYIRGEYALAIRRLSIALEQCRARGFLGQGILGSDLAFDLWLVTGAGAYICGEETALFESIEGGRGEPRLRPPYPTQEGLWGHPTVINNVETLANVPPIVERGGAWYAALGTEGSSGVKLFCVSGQVRRPGVYELPFGATLERLIHECAGGPRDGRRLKAVLAGGASGTFLTERHLGVTLDYPSLLNAGSMLGSGAFTVVDDSASLWDVLEWVARFFAHESCGKCAPCQIGSHRLVELVQRMRQRGIRDGDQDLLGVLHRAMSDSAICGLGQVAAAPIMSGVDLIAAQGP